ncbi:MAG: SUMF1/EgtB/PvdO family nonheme iron enzyme [Alphaproteobacteria bacterium]|nr:SUMF1/EgtB/PvdO family nonheme iron enzyme [Alphaproteobacteria bacterium]
MGSPAHEKNRRSNEGPRHRVKIGYKFAVGKFEVTQAEWRHVMGTNAPDKAGPGWVTARPPSTSSGRRPDCPT